MAGNAMRSYRLSPAVNGDQCRIKFFEIGRFLPPKTNNLRERGGRASFGAESSQFN